MSMKSIAFILILIAAFGSAIWNVHVKKSDNSLAFVTLMVIPQCAVSIPLMFFSPDPSKLSLYFIVISALVQTGYIIFLSFAYQHGMLSSLYPVAVGTAPLFSLLFWHMFLRKNLFPLDYYGVLLISLSIMLFALLQKKKKEHFSLEGLVYALITGVFIFSYTIIDTFGIRTVSNPLTYMSWLFTIKGLMLLIPMLLLHHAELKAMIKKNNMYLIAGLLAGFGYSVSIWAFLHASTPVVLALRSTSIWFVFLLSIFLLKEKISMKVFLLTLTTSIGVFLILITG